MSNVQSSILPSRRAAVAAALVVGILATATPAAGILSTGAAVARTPVVGEAGTHAGHQLAGRKYSLAPFAHAVFCITYHDQCRVQRRSIRKSGVHIGGDRLAHLTRVNGTVNRAIRPQADAPGLQGDRWLVGPSRGDCDDYAVTKRAQLLKEGWPSRALLLAMATLPDGQEHLVLIARGTNGDFVLDNLRREVLPISSVRYRWTKIQDQEIPKFWRDIDRRHELIALAPQVYDTTPDRREASLRKSIRVATADWSLRGSLLQ